MQYAQCEFEEKLMSLSCMNEINFHNHFTVYNLKFVKFRNFESKLTMEKNIRTIF